MHRAARARAAPRSGSGSGRYGCISWMSIAEQPLEILGRRLEERPLVALEVHPHDAPEHRQRLVAAGVQQLDEHVRVAVGLGVRAVRRRAARAAGRSPGSSPHSEAHVAGRVALIAARQPARAPRRGQRATVEPVRAEQREHDPLVRRTPRQAVCATPPSASSIP